MSMKHTPGPWTYHWGSDAIVKAKDGRVFAIGDVIYHEDNKANARLIAASPYLLEALREMLTALELEGADSQRFFEARNSGLAAINKAEGRE